MRQFETTDIFHGQSECACTAERIKNAQGRLLFQECFRPFHSLETLFQTHATDGQVLPMHPALVTPIVRVVERLKMILDVEVAGRRLQPLVGHFLFDHHIAYIDQVVDIDLHLDIGVE